MELPANLLPGRFVERPNRFITVVDTPHGRVTAHLPSTGRLREILVPGREVYLSSASRPGRKTHYSLIVARLDRGLVCLDSRAPHLAAAEFFRGGSFTPFDGYTTVVPEAVRLGSRYDLILSGPGRGELIVEVKGVTLVREGRALFPDAPTARGAR